MTRFGRIRRRPDHWASPHERARVRAAERLDGPLGLAEATWLDDAPRRMPDVPAIAAAYDADRQSLRPMRGTAPEPPRDLWARTAAAIEQESARARASTGHGLDRRVPLGALSGLAVVAVVVGVSTMSSGLFSSAAPRRPARGRHGRRRVRSPAAGTETQTSGGAAAQVEPTPIAVGVRVGSAGSTWIARTARSRSMPPTSTRSARPILASAARPWRIGPGAPRPGLGAGRQIIAAPDNAQAIVVSRDAGGTQQLLVVDLPAVDEIDGRRIRIRSPARRPAENAPPSTAPTAARAPARRRPRHPRHPPGRRRAPAPRPSQPVSDPPPAGPVSPSASPEATPRGRAGDRQRHRDRRPVRRLLQTMASGSRSRPAPAVMQGRSDVYLWKVGEDDAQPLTSDGMSSFASWSGDQVVVSRVEGMGDTSFGEGEGDPFEVSGTTVTIDPSAGRGSPTSSTWLPGGRSDEPDSRHRLERAPSQGDDDGVWYPAEGRLELQSWPEPLG